MKALYFYIYFVKRTLYSFVKKTVKYICLLGINKNCYSLHTFITNEQRSAFVVAIIVYKIYITKLV